VHAFAVLDQTVFGAMHLMLFTLENEIPLVEKTFEQEIYRSEKVRRFLLSEDNAASGDMSEVLLKQKHPRQLEEQVMSMQVPHVPSIPAGSHSEMQNIQLTVRNWIDRLYEETNDKFDRETGEKISLWKKSNPWVAMHNFVTAFDYYTYNPNTQAQKDYERKIELLMNALDNPVGKKKTFTGKQMLEKVYKPEDVQPIYEAFKQHFLTPASSL
jgi:hypothetical protein